MKQRRSKQAEQEEMGYGGSAPSSFIAGEGQPATPTITGNYGFLCIHQGLVKSGGCRGSVGKRRRPRPVNRHASSGAAGCWGLRCSTLAIWLRLEAKSERALGPGATVGVLGMGVPRLASLRPTAWLHQRPCMAHLHQQTLKTLTRGQASRGGRSKTSSGVASPGWLVRGREIKVRQTSRGSSDVSHDDRDQDGARRAPARTVSLLPLWC